MRDIIFISFEFPPLNIGGVFRSAKFVKYLPENGIRPTVYTLSPTEYLKVYKQFNTDYSLLEDLPSRDIVLRHIPINSIWDLYSSRIKSFWNIYFNTYRGSEFKKWRIHLLKQIRSDVSSTSFKAVVVTAPPFGMLALAREIAEELKLPLIIDMRDAWAYWNLNGYGTYFHYLSTLKKERKYFKTANKIIATSEQTIADWQQLHSNIPKSKFECITNGYDIDINNIGLNKINVSPITEIQDVFTIAYVGSFYYSPESRVSMEQPFYKKRGLKMLQYYPRKQDWLYRSPYFFLKTLSRVFELEPSFRNRMRVVFAGNRQPWLNAMILEFGLENEVTQIGFVNHDKSLQLQSDANALLITSAKVTNGRDCFIAGKTFEYITMKKPILAFVAEGAQKDILKQTGLAIFFDPDNIDEAALNMVEMLKNGLQLNIDNEYLRSFHRKSLAARFASIIHKTIDSK